MLKKILFVVSALALARAQIPSLGWCPEYVPMANFDMSKFLGVWYEAERYFQITEVVSRCVMANYTKGPDGKLRVSNEVTNRLTGIKRVLEGEIKASSSKADEGKLHVKYTVPFTPETQYAVLDTDYKNYAVMWSCSGIGPINAQNAWLMTRARLPPGEVLQKAYGVLDKYKISKTFFVKTDQDDCAYLDSNPVTTPKPAESTDKPAVEEASEEAPVEEAQQAKSVVNFRSAIVPDAPAIIIATRKAEIAEAAEKPAVEPVVEKAVEPAVEPVVQPAVEPVVAAEPEPQSEVLPEAAIQVEVKPEIQNAEPVVAVEAIEAAKENKEESKVVKKAVEAEIPPPASVPEVILKAADRAKELVKESTDEAKQLQPLEAIQEFFANPAAQIQEALAKPAAQLQEAFAKPAAQFQEAISKPLAQIQQTFATPLQNIQQAFNRPAEVTTPEAVEAAPAKLEEPAEKPAEPIKEALNAAPAAKAAPEAAPEAPAAKLPEAVEEKAAAPKEEDKKAEEKKVES